MFCPQLKYRPEDELICKNESELKLGRVSWYNLAEMLKIPGNFFRERGLAP